MSAKKQAMIGLIISIEQQLAVLKQMSAMDEATGYNQQPRQQAPQNARYTNAQEDAIIAERLALQQEAEAGGPVDDEYYPPEPPPQQRRRPAPAGHAVPSGGNQRVPPNMRAANALIQQVLNSQGGDNYEG